MTHTNTPTTDEQPAIERGDARRCRRPVRCDGGRTSGPNGGGDSVNDGTADDHAGDGDERPTILVPLEVLEGESVPDGIGRLLGNARVVLLGYHVIPEQTATEQAREQFGETAMGKLSEFADRLTAAGAEVETRLVFTHDGQTTIDRIIYEHDCLAVLVPNSLEDAESVLVAVRGTVGIGRNTRLVAGLFAGTDVDVTLYHVLGSEESEDDAETLLNGVKTELVERGMDPSAITTRIEETETPVEAISQQGKAHDAVVMGETDPSVATFVFGMPSKQVAERFLGPVLVVQRERPAEADENGTEEGDTPEEPPSGDSAE